MRPAIGDDDRATTREKMTENLRLYAAIGYVEYDRRAQGNFSPVFMRKRNAKAAGMRIV